MAPASSNKWGNPKRTRADFAQALTLAVHRMTDARLFAITADELARTTGADARLCEAKLNARRDVVTRLRKAGR